MLTLLDVIGKAKQQEKIIMTRIRRIIEIALLCAFIILSPGYPCGSPI